MLMTGAVPLKAAQAKVLAHCQPLPAECLQGLLKARGRILAEDVKATRDLPQAPTSIVDGYAVCSEDFDKAPKAHFTVCRHRQDGAAGAGSQAALEKMEAAYVTTGALLPPRADAVRPNEEAKVVENGVVELSNCERGKWVRWPGSDMKAGEVILTAGHQLSAMDLSALAAIGQAQALVRQRPKVAVLSTGRELIDPESSKNELPEEKIFDANRHMLLAMAEEEGAEVIDAGIIGDESSLIKEKLSSCASIADVVICSGGVSEGEFDFVRPALRDMGNLLFEKVVMKPGKPASCAVLKGDSSSDASKTILLFGLPGNPASAAVTFRLLVAPALQRLIGREDLGQPRLNVKVKETVVADPDRPEWVRARLAWEGSQLVAMHTGLQRSSRAASLANASALLELVPGQRVQAGERVDALVLSSLPANSCTAGDPHLQEQLQAATFRQLVAHLRENPLVQNIDLMNLAGFCRNCLAKWYMKTATSIGYPMTYEIARKVVYGMTYDTWKELYQMPSDAPKETSERSAKSHSSGGSGKSQDTEKDKDGNAEGPPTESFEAGAFQHLVDHLRQHPEVQNIDLMNLSGFCRNCLSKWYRKAAEERGLEMDYEKAREIVYGMPYEEFKKLHQTPASAEQMQAFNAAHGTTTRPSPAVKHSDVCTGGTEQGAALEAAEASDFSFPVLRVGVLTVSDRAAAKVYEDRSGPAVADTLKTALKGISRFPAEHLQCIKHTIVADEQLDIERELRDWCDGSDPMNLILTTGGTGCAPRDVTPEATRAVCDKDAPGLSLAALQAGAQHHPLALASRLVAGIRNRTVILNLPGQPKAVVECLDPVVPLLLRAVSLCDQPGKSISRDPK